MRVFVTGSTGFIGTSLVPSLLSNGHTVLGLYRSESSKAQLLAQGAEPHHGSLDDIDSLRAGVQACDSVIHLAFTHNMSDFVAACEADNLAVKAMTEALGNEGKPFITAAGTLVNHNAGVSNEDSKANVPPPLSIRAETESYVLGLANKGVRSCSVRIPPTAHGKGDAGMIPMYANATAQAGKLYYVGEGKNVWPAAHRDDVATLFRLALEKGKAGSVYLAAAENAVPIKDIVTAMGKKLNRPVESIESVEKLMEIAGFFAIPYSADNPTENERTKAELGWKPEGLGLLQDIEKNYFGNA